MAVLSDGLERMVYEGDARGEWAGSVWWYYRARDTGVLVGVLNGRWEPDEDGLFWTYDELVICEGTPSGRSSPLPYRAATEDEVEEYIHDIRDHVRAD